MKEVASALAVGLAISLVGTPGSAQTTPPATTMAGPTQLELSVQRQLRQLGHNPPNLSLLTRHEISAMYLALSEDTSQVNKSQRVNTILEGRLSVIRRR